MNPKITAPIPEAIAQLQRQLDQFRSTQPRRTKLPEPLWQVAVELAREYGIYSVAHPLRLDYMGLKKRLGGIPTVGGPGVALAGLAGGAEPPAGTGGVGFVPGSDPLWPVLGDPRGGREAICPLGPISALETLLIPGGSRLRL